MCISAIVPVLVKTLLSCSSSFFFLNDTATTEIYTLSLHDALPICHARRRRPPARGVGDRPVAGDDPGRDRKSTRLNSSHGYISYAVFRLKKQEPTRGTDFVSDKKRGTDEGGVHAPRA